jgi:hypothetical protein
MPTRPVVQALRNLKIAPPSKPQLLPKKPGYIKTRLSYWTATPSHIRNIALREQCGAQPPYIEDVCVLLLRTRTFSLLESFMPAFDALRAAEVVPQDANLRDFKVLDEDDVTLAYVP